MNCGVVVVEEDQEEQRKKMKTTIKMHKTFYAAEMSREAKWHRVARADQLPDR